MQRLRVPKDPLGRFPARHHLGVDPGLVGIRAFSHPAVREWHRWLVDRWLPGWPVAIITPCSNVKPYTRSPTSRKAAALLRRLGLWRDGGPFGVEWLYLSDLLVLVPYVRAEEYRREHDTELDEGEVAELWAEGLLEEAHETLYNALRDCVARRLRSAAR